MKLLFAIVFGLIGLLMSSCGLIFLTLGGGSVGIIALPSLIVGGLLIWAAHALWTSRKKARESLEAPSPPEPK